MLRPDSLRALLMPSSVALVGASDTSGSIGRIVLENLLGGGFHGMLHVVNPAHRRVLGQRSYGSLTAIGKAVELALIAAPFAAVPDILADAARARVRAAVIFSTPPINSDEARGWQAELLSIASKAGIRILGPHSFGVIRTDLGLNATVSAAVAQRGKLALLAQSGAVCAAMLDFAASEGIGFSTVAALGGGIDIGFGELLDGLLADAQTEGILIYAETVGDARRFVSALRASARTKPVVVLKAGRSLERATGEAPSPDAVFDAAMKRAGSVRVKTYAQLFAAARVLAMHRIARGDRLAIVTNGHGPGMLAADSAADRGMVLADLMAATKATLGRVLPPGVVCRNPINVRGDATPARFAAALEAALSDAQVDAALVLHVPRPATGATDAARAVAAVARRAEKPVLSVWLGAVDRRESSEALEAGGIANFYTPEHAVEAFSYLAAYRHHQQWLLEVPPPQPEPAPPDLRAVERIRIDTAATDRRELSEWESHTLLATFGLPVPPMLSADTLAEALNAARRLRYPVTLRSNATAHPSPIAESGGREGLRNGRMLTRAWAALLAGPANARKRAAVIICKGHAFEVSSDVAIGVRTDAVFGPVITVSAGGRGAASRDERIVLLPPLNQSLAHDLIRDTRIAAALRAVDTDVDAPGALARVLVQVSALVCALPWVRALTLDPVRIGGGHAEIVAARVAIDPRAKPPARSYGHMAIHPYPIEMVADVALPDGARLHVRPIRPEDAELERAFVAGMSDQTRYFRFFYQLNELTPGMLARFTQVDYDREMALVAVDEAHGAPAIVGVARYIMSADRESAEFAVAVTDAWHGRGVARMLMTRLIACARMRGLKRLEGTVLRSNHTMLKFTAALGFAKRDDPADAEQVCVVLDLD